MTRMRFPVLTAMFSTAALALVAALPALAHGATGDEPAGGAAAGEAIGATAAALVVTGLIALLIAGHRSGRVPWLDTASRFFERQTGLPGWAALPSAVLGISLLTAVTGMYWDISLHIDNGRDAGPLANPAHYLILIGLYGTLLAGALTMALSRGRPSDAAVYVGGGWWAPAGGLMIAACGAFALTGFPLDDLWHRLFGQDVTLWGPTHLMLIGGGSLATLGAMALTTEALAAKRGEHAPTRVAAGPPDQAGVPGRRVPGRALHLPGRVRLRRAPVPAGASPDPDHARRRHRPGHGSPVPGARRRAPGRGRLPRDPRVPRADRRGRLRPDHSALPALHRRGAARGARVPARHPAPAGGRRRAGGRLDRDDRAGGGVGLVARMDADSRGRRRCCRRPPSRVSWPPWPEVRWAASWAPRWCARGRSRRCAPSAWRRWRPAWCCWR